MPHYVVGSFEPGKSGSSYSFVCKRPEPAGPFVMLNTKRIVGIEPNIGTIYLLEIQDGSEFYSRVQYVQKVITSIAEVQQELVGALRFAEWERDKHGKPTGIVGGALKTIYGYFSVHYDNGIRRNGMDESPSILFRSCQLCAENPYAEALSTALAESYLSCVNKEELQRAHG